MGLRKASLANILNWHHKENYVSVKLLSRLMRVDWYIIYSDQYVDIKNSEIRL